MRRISKLNIGAGQSRFGRAGLVAVASLLTLPGFSQAQLHGGPSAGANHSNEALRASGDEVSIALVVRDKKKRPVENLTATDISVSDAGNPVQLSDLHLVTLKSGESATISLVFDRLPPAAAKAVEAVVSKLIAMAPEHTVYGVFGIDGGLRLFQTFTDDRGAVLTASNLAIRQTPGQALTDAEKEVNAVERTGAFPSGANASVDERAQAKIMLIALGESQRIAQDQHAPGALAGLEAIAKSQQNLPGRKIVVFFSAGLDTNSRSADATKEVIEAANRAGISIYTVDTNGVDRKSFDLLTMMYQPTGSLPVRSTPGVSGITVGPNMGRIELMQSTTEDAKSVSTLQREQAHSDENPLSALATETGGFSISCGDNIREPLERLVSDISSYYEASYTPELKTFDGEFHSIEIRPVRADLTIRSRAGYFALAPGAAGSFLVRPFEAPLLKILSDTKLPAAVDFRQEVLRLGEANGQSTNDLTIEVPLSSVELREDQRTLLYSAHFAILAQVRDKSGVVVQRFSQDVTRNGALEAVKDARAELFDLQRHFTAAPGDYVLEAAIVDLLGNKAGAQRTPFTIPSPAGGPWISDVALVRRTEPVGKAADPQDPMQYDKVRVVPNVSNEVPTGSPRIDFFFDLHPDRNLSGGNGKLEMDVQQDGKTLLHSSNPISSKPSSEDSLNLASIKSRNLQPGTYHAIFTFAQDDKSATRDVMFSMVGDPPPSDADESAASGDSSDESADPAAEATAAAESVLDLDPARFVHDTSMADRAPSAQYQDALLAGARKRAVTYNESLINFKCIEMTDRFIDRKGSGKWEPHDKIAEMVTFENLHEFREVLEVNGKPGDTEPPDMKGARLEGEFGGVLKAVFDPSSKAQFTWKETDAMEDGNAQVFAYHVDAKNSQFSVTALPATPVFVGFHGLVYIDDATRGVRRITMQADDIPPHSAVRASAIAIDYDYININDHDFLMPVEGQLRMRLGKREAILHRIEFRDYHRYGSDARIISTKPNVN